MTSKMICQDCGAAMNHHAEKIDYSLADETGAADPNFGGVLIEAHTCPRCGMTGARPAARIPEAETEGGE